MSTEAEFDVWGCRGSRSFAPGRSKIGSCTSCYSLHCGADLFVLDAGRGLPALADATESDPRFANVERIHVLVTHAHLDHWEGLKDASWFWSKNKFEVHVIGTHEALTTITRGLAPPAFVPLDLLAANSVAKLTWTEVKAGDTWKIGAHQIHALRLNHYSGPSDARCDLDTIGFRISLHDGPTIAYVSDHEPLPETQAMEDAAATDAALLVIDSQFADRKDHAFGHGSQEHAASCAKRHPQTMVLCGHHGPRPDAQIFDGHERHATGLPNLLLAIEGVSYVWNANERRFASFTR